MTVAEAVTKSTSPLEALLAVARGIDLILEREAKAEIWSEWGSIATASPVAATREDQPRTNFGALMTADQVPEAADAEIEVEVQPPSVERLLARKLLEEQSIHIGDYLNDHSEDWNLAYIKGGPVWLYTNNRELVISLPEATRKAMIEDVLEDNPEMAHEMSRDILKQPGETGPGSSAMQVADIL